MIENSCLRPACLSDVMEYDEERRRWLRDELRNKRTRSYSVVRFLERLYDAEWRKRGFERSP